jgi:hypothetical protein
MGSTGILIHPHCSKARVRARLEIEKPRMGRIRDNCQLVDVLLPEEPEHEFSNVLDFAHKRRGEFMLNAEIGAAHFRAFQMFGNRPNAPECFPPVQTVQTTRGWVQGKPREPLGPHG